MAEYKDSGDVLLTEADSVDVIEIAADWQTGLELWQQGRGFHQTGFLGKGYNKVGIYVS